MSDNRARRHDRIVDVLTAAPWPMTAKEIAQAGPWALGTVRSDLDTLTEAGRLERAGVSMTGAQCWRIP